MPPKKKAQKQLQQQRAQQQQRGGGQRRGGPADDEEGSCPHASQASAAHVERILAGSSAAPACQVPPTPTHFPRINNI